MEADTQTAQRRSRRTANADKLSGTNDINSCLNSCIACRQSKIKCSGRDPCQNCQRRAIECHFAVGGSKILVSEKYLQDLQKQAEENRQPSSTNNLDSLAQAAGYFRSPVDHHSEPAPTTQQYNLPCPPRDLVSHEEPPPWRGVSTNAVLGINTIVNDESGGRAGLVSPASTVKVTQRTEVDHGPVTTLQYPDASSPLDIWPNAFPMPVKIIRNSQKNRRTWIWLAPWSTWSCTMRLILLLREKLHPEDPSLPPNIVDPDFYTLTWETSSPSTPPDISGLPSLTHAIYLFNTVKFHLNHVYRLFNEQEFEDEIREFYANASEKAADCRLWFAKFLLILTFGTAFHSPPTDSPEPPGAKLFARAMALIPNTTSLWKDSLLAIEVLTLVSLYLFSVNEREAAHIYLGQAIRIAQLEGLHTELPEQELGPNTTAYCRDLWWTLYIMDRHYSCSLGIPMSVKDSDITTPVPSPNADSPLESARSLQVNLSNLLSVILTTVYKPTITPLATFLEQTRSILHTLAHHAQEIERIINLKLESSVGTIPRSTSYLTLLYHQCVIVATRPLLFSILKERLDMLGHQGNENWDNFLAKTGAVISIGIKSASKTLQILTSEYSLLESFLPYDVEFAFGAALHLTMADALFPDVEDYQKGRQLAHQILDSFVSRGSRVARARRTELSHTETLCQELVAEVEQQGHQALHLLYSDGMAADLARKTNEEQERLLAVTGGEPNAALEMTGDLGNHLPTLNGNLGYLDDIGISSEDFLSIVQQMGNAGDLPESMLTLS
ncbi:fungal-specific transcription factor domain-containing protein [Trichoderma barbatum]